LSSSHCAFDPGRVRLQHEAAARLLAVQDEHGVPALERLSPR
jgi:hypothetical protein